MVGYGPEDDHFVVELTYNYGIKEYKLGNDFQVSLSVFTFCQVHILGVVNDTSGNHWVSEFGCL